MNVNIDKLNIYYEEFGDAKDNEPVILFLHGWGADHRCFLPIISGIKNKYKTYALDLPGHGESSSLTRSFNVDDYKNVIIKFINLMNIKNIILIGHSYGGRIIIKINSEDNIDFNIEKNILIDSAGIKKNQSTKNKIKIITYKFAKNILNVIPNKNKKEELLNKLKRKFGSTDYNNATPIMRETLVKSVNEDLTPLLKNMRETLLIWGENDKDTPLSDAKIMEKEIKNAGLVVLKNTGHFSFLEDKYTFEKVIKSYLKI